MPFHIPRIDSLIGAALEEAGEPDLNRLALGQVSEDVDLEYKEQIYGNSDHARRDLAGDIAAFANTVGGLLVIGISEDNLGRAAHLAPVSLQSEEILRMRQVVASLVAPPPDMSLRVVTSANTQGASYILATVPPSIYRPHGVRVTEGFRFPVRDGAGIRYLSEPELADMYRSRFVALQGQVERLDQLESEALESLSPAGTWLSLSLVPVRRGTFSIDSASVRSFEQALRDFNTGVLGPDRFFGFSPSAIAGVQRASAASSEDAGLADDDYVELHADGAAFVAHRVSREGWPSDDVHDVPDETIVLFLIEMLSIAHRLVIDLARGGGDCLARANLLLPGDDAHRGIDLVHFRNFGAQHVTRWNHSRSMKRPLQMTHTLPLEALRSSRDLLVSARILANDIFQACGVAEVPQLTREGGFRLRYFVQQRQQWLTQWAQQVGVDVVQDALL